MSDPFGAEAELINIESHFYQGQYQEVIDFDTTSFSAENALPARVLQLRARIALGQAEDVLAEVAGEKKPELEAVGALAQLKAGDAESAVETIEQLAATDAGEIGIVQVVGGTVLAAAGKADEALALLQRHQGNLEAVALIVHIYLAQNRTESAVKEVASARRLAQDSLLFNLAESWVGLRLVSFPTPSFPLRRNTFAVGSSSLLTIDLCVYYHSTGRRQVPASILRL